MKNFRLIVPILTLALLGVSCSEKPRSAEKDSQKEEALKEEAAKPMTEHINRAYYPIPSPEQMFSFINDNGVPYKKEMTNDIGNNSKYTDPVSKALNFGVYTADLAYSASYQNIEATIDYYKVVKQLGAELNISEIMSEEMMQQMQENLQNPDSLSLLAGNSYYQAVEHLEQNRQEGKLALMSLGGWVESIYITINSMPEYDQNSATVQRIADQKITFGNLYTYLKRFSDKTGVKQEIENVQPIRKVFSSLMEERSANANGEKTGNKMVLGRISKIKLTKPQFEELKAAINNYRSKITGK